MPVATLDLQSPDDLAVVRGGRRVAAGLSTQWAFLCDAVAPGVAMGHEYCGAVVQLRPGVAG